MNNVFSEMLSGVVGEMQNDTTNNISKQAKLVYVHLGKLKENKFNSKRILKDVDLLAENILNGGLQQPIVIKPDYTIITGHKRTAAIHQIADAGKTYFFNGRECIAEVPAFIVEYDEEVQERLGILQSNSHNDETKEEKISRTKEAEEIYSLLCERNERPSGLKRRWIAAITGYSERSVQDYLNEMSEDEASEKAEEKKEKRASKQEKNTSKTMLKKIKSFNQYLSKMDLNNLEIEDMMEISEALQDCTAIIEQMLS